MKKKKSKYPEGSMYARWEHDSQSEFWIIKGDGSGKVISSKDLKKEENNENQKPASSKSIKPTEEDI